MNSEFAENLQQGVVCVDLKGETKGEIIRELVGLLAEAGLISDVEAVSGSVLEREKSMSTGMQYGVAVPHGKTDAVESMVTAVGLKKDGVDFDSFDGEPCRFFVMTISPRLITGPHVRFLGHIGSLLESAEMRKRLLAAQTPLEMIDILTK